jgi:hypothetical protein
VIRIGFKLDGLAKVVEQTIVLQPLLSFFFADGCVDMSVLIAYVNKSKPLFQQLEIVRIVDSYYRRVKSELLCWCNTSVLHHWAQQRRLSISNPHMYLYFSLGVDSIVVLHEFLGETSNPAIE